MKLPKSYDMVGDILILEIPDNLKKRQKQIAKRLLKEHSNIKTIVKKAGMHKGVYRTQKSTWLAGKRKKETEYKENNVRLRMNIDSVYFSSRLAHERLRIAKQVRLDEEILVMFSGIAPYCLVIEKNSKAKEIYGIEINPSAHKYALENLKINKSKRIRLFKGDVKKILPKIKKKYDRIVMAWPGGATQFLDLALKKLKKKGIIHFYDFQEKEEIQEKIKEKITNACSKQKKKLKSLKVIKCGQYSPRKYRVCADFRIS